MNLPKYPTITELANFIDSLPIEEDNRIRVLESYRPFYEFINQILKQNIILIDQLIQKENVLDLSNRMN